MSNDDGAFVLDEVMQPMRYEGLSQWGVPDGTIPEPTDWAFSQWRDALNRIGRDALLDIPEGATPMEVAEAVIAADQQRMNLDTVDAYAVLMGATPPTTARPKSPERPRGKKLPKAQQVEGEPERFAEPTEAELDEWEKARRAYPAQLTAWYETWEGGSPTRAQLGSLPFRVQKHLFAYVTARFRDEDFVPAATKA